MSRNNPRGRGRLGWAVGAIALALGAATPAGAEDKPLPDVEEKAKDYELSDGFFRVYQKKQHLLVEIPRQRIGKPFLLTTSVAGGSASTGFQWTDMLVQWDRLDDKLLLIEKNVQYRAQKGEPLAEVVEKTYTDRVVKAMPILAESKNGSPKRGVLVDLSDLFAANAKTFFGGFGAALDPSIARVDKVKAFPENLEIAITMPDRQSGQLVTLAYSLVNLPEAGYQPREADPRVGYFLTAVKDFSRTSTDTRFVRYVNRWRLDKKDANLALSPPVKPIIFYIERTVPVRFRRWVREGILEWNKAFEKVGFYNAVIVEDHELFPDRDPEDARYSFFRWITSDRGFAMGPSRVNPMTGEIFDADIIFDDAMVRSYLREYELMLKETPGTFFGPRDLERYGQDPFWHPFHGTRLEAGPRDLLAGGPSDRDLDLHAADELRGLCGMGSGVSHELFRAELAFLAGGDERAKGADWPEEFIGRMVKEVVMHEVGHTLGLRHNFVASTWKPLAEMGAADPNAATIGSVMDYNPVFVALPGEKQTAYTTGSIGPYDFWAIEYGYKPVKEADELKKIASRIAEAGLDYATDEDTSTGDPYVMRWDLGQDPLVYAAQRLDLVDKLLPKLKDRVVLDGQSYKRLREAVLAMLYDAHFAGQIAAGFVGGERYVRDHKGDPNARAPLTPVSADKQREAVKLACDRILAPGFFQLDPELIKLLGTERWWTWGEEPGDPGYAHLAYVSSVQRSVLMGLIAPSRLEKVYDHQFKVGAEEPAYTIGEHFGAITTAVFSELAKGPELKHTVKKPYVTPQRQTLQRTWVEALVRLTAKGATLGPEITRSIARRELEGLAEKLAKVKTDGASEAARSGLDVESAAHLAELRRRIDKALDADFVQ